MADWGSLNVIILRGGFLGGLMRQYDAQLKVSDIPLRRKHTRRRHPKEALDPKPSEIISARINAARLAFASKETRATFTLRLV